MKLSCLIMSFICSGIASANPPATWRDMGAGGNHTCFINQSIGYCFGGGKNGQTGQSDATSHALPKEVAALDAVQSIALGKSHSCAIARGKLYCWGSNSHGQLGDGTKTNSAYAVLVKGLTNLLSVSLGSQHTCANTAEQTFCWGAGKHGALGVGDKSGKNRPVPIPVQIKGEKPLQVAAGEQYSCALTASGKVYCWGLNRDGQLGVDSQQNVYAPKEIVGDIRFKSISAGKYHTCGISTAFDAYCWGNSRLGKLGSSEAGDDGHVLKPILVESESLYSEVSTGEEHSCGITTEGKIHCWGQGSYGQLGSGNQGSNLPIPIDYPQEFRHLSLGAHHSCARTMANDLVCWGRGNDGQNGNSSKKDSPAPQSIALKKGAFASIDLGYEHGCAINDEGGAYCWGSGKFGRRADGRSLATTSWPTKVRFSNSVTEITVSWGGGCFLAADALVYCWGDNTYGANGSTEHTKTNAIPKVVERLVDVTQISRGNAHTCALTGKKVGYCWGLGNSGQRGDGSYELIKDSPEPIKNLDNIITLSAGGEHTCAIETSGAMYCWGEGIRGELGTGTFPKRLLTPHKVKFDKPWSQVSAGVRHVCAIDKKTDVYCWGLGDAGQRGDGTLTEKVAIPTKVKGITGITKVSSGQYHTCAIDSAGKGWCWGRGDFGQRGDSKPEQFYQPSPVQITNNPIDEPIKDISVGRFFTCVVYNSGKTHCFGKNDFKQIIFDAGV